MHENSATWVFAVFAHNEAANIAACIDSIVAAAGSHLIRIHILANGCTDQTASVVAQKQSEIDGISLTAIKLADKANAWNHYVHELAATASTHFFVDGDVTLDPESLQRLDAVLASSPAVNAAAAVPGNGRDRTDWIKRMVEHGRVSGGLYALRGAFVGDARAQGIRLPVGLIGDDFLVSALAKGITSADAIYRPDRKLAVVTDAVFRFHALPGTSLRHLPGYIRRLVRYRVRSYQLSLVFDLVSQHGFRALPSSMQAVYHRASRLPGYYWRGRETPVDWLAVMQIRHEAKQVVRQDRLT